MFFTTPGPLNYAEADVKLRMEKAFGLARDRELGASAIEWVIISAILILITSVVGGILFTKIKGKADQLDLGTTTGP